MTIRAMLTGWYVVFAVCVAGPVVIGGGLLLAWRALLG
jgi:hypothetical protein